MVKTVFQDIIAITIVGALFARVGQRYVIQAPTLFMSRAFRYAFFFVIFIWSPIALYLLMVYPAWSWWYYVPPQKFTFYHIIGPVILEIFLMIAGFAVAGEYVKKGKFGLANTFIAGLVIAYLAILVFPMDVWTRLGTYEEFYSGQARPIFEQSRARIEFLIIGLYFFLPLVYLFSRLSKKD